METKAGCGALGFALIVLLTTLLSVVILLAGCQKSMSKMTSDELVEKGYEYIDDDNYDKAIEVFEQLIETEPKNVEGYIGLAEAYLGNDDEKNAAKALRSGLKAVRTTKRDEIVEFAEGSISEEYYDTVFKDYPELNPLEGLSETTEPAEPAMPTATAVPATVLPTTAPAEAPATAPAETPTAVPTPTPFLTNDPVRIAYSDLSGSVDPNLVYGQMKYILDLIYEPLWYIGAYSADLEFALATGYDKIDGHTYSVHLREGVYFANGQVFNAYDVLYSFDRARNAYFYYPGLAQLDISNSYIIDDYTVELAFYDDSYNNITMLASIPMLDLETTENLYMDYSNSFGTGPYEIRDYTPFYQLKLTRRDGYWGELPEIDSFVFYSVDDDATKCIMLEAGEIDVALGVNSADANYLSSWAALDVAGSATGIALYFNVDSDSIFYKEPNIRQAIAYAINREQINDYVYYGYGGVPHAPVVGSAADGAGTLDLGVYGDGYSFEKAAELAASSWITNGYSVRLIIPNFSDKFLLIAELIQGYCLEVGIEVHIITYEFSDFVQMFYSGTSGYDLALGYIDIGDSSSGLAHAYNEIFTNMANSSYTYADYDGQAWAAEILDTIKEPYSAAERIVQLSELATIVNEEMLWLNLVTPPDIVAMNPGLGGSVRNFDGLPSLFRNLYWK